MTASQGYCNLASNTNHIYAPRTARACPALLRVSMTANPPDDGLLVIGAGLMRTGTNSLQIALQRLFNGKCYNKNSVFRNPRHVDFWIAAAAKDPSDEEWRKFFADYKATVDLPSTAFYQRLMEVYPNAKVILTVRDPRRWFHSVNTTIAPPPYNYLTELPVKVVRKLSGSARVYKMIKAVTTRVFDCDLNDEEKMIAAYNRHVEEVKRVVPAERLLVFEVKEGWEPLCSFLGMDVPQEMFPHVNSSHVNRARERRKRKRICVFALLSLTSIIYVLYLLGQSNSTTDAISGHFEDEF